MSLKVAIATSLHELPPSDQALVDVSSGQVAMRVRQSGAILPFPGTSTTPLLCDPAGTITSAVASS